MKQIRYISLFSGIGGFELGIQNIFPNAKCLGFSEIDKHCVAFYNSKFPDHPYLGGIEDIDFTPFLGKVDLVVGGSPCKDLSRARNACSKEKKGLKGDQSKLFYEFIRCLKECQPKYFILENVSSMNKNDAQVITQVLHDELNVDVEAKEINSADFCAQSRKRLFWCNFEIGDKKIYNDVLKLYKDIPLTLKEVIDHVQDPESLDLVLEQKILDYLFQKVEIKGHSKVKKRIEAFPYYNDSDWEKSRTIISYNNSNYHNVLFDRRFEPVMVRRMLPEEYEMLQGLPVGYTEGMESDHKRIYAIGNAVTVPVISYLVSHLRGLRPL